MSEQPPVIGAGMMETRVDFERGMSYFPALTLILIILCVVCYAGQLAGGGFKTAEELLALGAAQTPAILGGDWWRLNSSTFMHGSGGHLIGNMLILYVVGMGCEHAYGRGFTLTAFIWTGVLASAASCFQSKISVGASGAIFGLAGLLSVTLLRHKDRIALRDNRVGFVLAIWAIYTLAQGFLSPFTDNLAHAGGLLGGCVLALLVTPDRLFSPKEGSRLGEAALAGLGATAVAVAYTGYFFVPALWLR